MTNYQPSDWESEQLIEVLRGYGWKIVNGREEFYQVLESGGIELLVPLDVTRSDYVHLMGRVKETLEFYAERGRVAQKVLTKMGVLTFNGVSPEARRDNIARYIANATRKTGVVPTCVKLADKIFDGNFTREEIIEMVKDLNVTPCSVNDFERNRLGAEYAAEMILVELGVME